jgi:hypothetical protein
MVVRITGYAKTSINKRTAGPINMRIDVFVCLMIIPPIKKGVGA